MKISIFCDFISKDKKNIVEKKKIVEKIVKNFISILQKSLQQKKIVQNGVIRQKIKQKSLTDVDERRGGSWERRSVNPLVVQNQNMFWEMPLKK